MGDIFGSKAPPPPKPVPMPDPEDPVALATKRKQIEEAAARSGRMSTMLSEDYGNNRLGGK